MEQNWVSAVKEAPGKSWHWLGNKPDRRIRLSSVTNLKEPKQD